MTKQEYGGAKESVRLTFEHNALLPQVFGHGDRHLKYVEKTLDITISSRGNCVVIEAANADHLEFAQEVLKAMYGHIQSGDILNDQEIDLIIRTLQQDPGNTQVTQGPVHEVVTKNRRIRALTPGQEVYLQKLQTCDLLLAEGPAGTGKTYFATAYAVQQLISGAVERIILSRPAVEAGERLGFLPGDMRDKIDPYLRPLYDALRDMLPADLIERRINEGVIEIAPLAFMRGRTLSRAFVILDEAQNTSCEQMKMFLTRFGARSQVVVNGDLSQIDLPRHTPSGLAEAICLLKDTRGIGTLRFQLGDVMRHPLVQRIVDAYDRKK